MLNIAEKDSDDGSSISTNGCSLHQTTLSLLLVFWTLELRKKDIIIKK